jgi:hypothetical protein
MDSAGGVTLWAGELAMEVPRLRTRPPVEADGFFLRRNPSPQRTNRLDEEKAFVSGAVVGRCV